GLVVDVAENGQVALHRMTQQRYDAVIMDMHMPVMDGLTATHTMRSNAQWDAIPIIAMTANNMDSDIQRCMDAGMCDFVTKPIDPDRLREAIRKWVTATKPTAAPVPEIAPPNPRMAAPAPEKSRSLVEALSHINGLDASYGLQNFAGKQATYREMLRRFLVQHQDIATPLQGALSSNNWHMLSQLAQATAEAATHVGALGVAAHARHLLALALQENSNADCQTLLNELVQSIHTLTDSVKNALGPVFRIDALSPIQG
ncbi:MAG: response regulator, partial [Comamonas sp.]